MKKPKTKASKPPKPPKDNKDIFRELVETLELTVRGARRCAYDLRHCADSLSSRRPRSASDSEMMTMFSDRANMWVGMFQSGNAMKDYRHRLYHQIGELEHKVKLYKEVLAKHKLTSEDPFPEF